MSWLRRAGTRQSYVGMIHNGLYQWIMDANETTCPHSTHPSASIPPTTWGRGGERGLWPGCVGCKSSGAIFAHCVTLPVLLHLQKSRVLEGARTSILCAVPVCLTGQQQFFRRSIRRLYFSARIPYCAALRELAARLFPPRAGLGRLGLALVKLPFPSVGARCVVCRRVRKR